VNAERRADGQPLWWEVVYLTMQPLDPVRFDKRDALGTELGEAGDPRAGAVLQRIAARDGDPDKRARTERLLDALP
jgi:hypothetical protein